MGELQHILAKNLRQARQKSGLSQEELANASGVDRTYVSGIERGIRNPTISVLNRFAATLGVDAFALLTPDYFAE